MAPAGVGGARGMRPLPRCAWASAGRARSAPHAAGTGPRDPCRTRPPAPGRVSANIASVNMISQTRRQSVGAGSASTRSGRGAPGGGAGSARTRRMKGMTARSAKKTIEKSQNSSA